MGCKNIFFLQPTQVFNLLYFNTLKKNTDINYVILFQTVPLPATDRKTTAG